MPGIRELLKYFRYFLELLVLLDLVNFLSLPPSQRFHLNIEYHIFGKQKLRSIIKGWSQSFARILYLPYSTVLTSAVRHISYSVWSCKLTSKLVGPSTWQYICTSFLHSNWLVCQTVRSRAEDLLRRTLEEAKSSWSDLVYFPHSNYECVKYQEDINTLWAHCCHQIILNNLMWDNHNKIRHHSNQIKEAKFVITQGISTFWWLGTSLKFCICVWRSTRGHQYLMASLLSPSGPCKLQWHFSPLWTELSKLDGVLEDFCNKLIWVV